MAGLQRAPQLVGTITLVVGAALAVAPRRATGPLGLDGQETAVRVVGVTDLVVAAGLLGRRPAWPWMAARAALNVALLPRAPRTFAILTVLDGGTALTLRAIERA